MLTVLVLVFIFWVWALFCYSNKSEKCLVVDAIVLDKGTSRSNSIHPANLKVPLEYVEGTNIGNTVLDDSRETKHQIEEAAKMGDCKSTAHEKYLLNFPEPTPSLSDDLLNIACPRLNSKVVVIMPYIKAQLQNVMQNMDTWVKYFPCSEAFALRTTSDRTTAGEHSKVQFFFYFNNGPDPEVENAIREKWETLNQAPIVSERRNNGEAENVTVVPFPIEKCFDIGFLWADMKEEELNHHKNTAVQFMHLFQLLDPLNVGYFFQMEPDTWPVRRNWIDKIFFESVCGANFWIKGSTFRNAQRRHLHFHGDHINGNALYNAQNPDFRWLLQRQIRPERERPYDLALWDAFARPSEFKRDHVHMYLHVNWIFNYGAKPDGGADWKPWTPEEINRKSPDTYLVHGKL